MAEIKVLIAHRGLIEGPDKKIENSPNQILFALNSGFHAEIDLWKIEENFYLGHDEPTYRVDENFLYQSGLWIHSKNLDALYWLSKRNLVYFWHQNDDRVITSNGYIWTYPKQALTDRSIRLMPEWHDPEFNTIKNYDCYAICSDYVKKIKSILTPSTEV